MHVVMYVFNPFIPFDLSIFHADIYYRSLYRLVFLPLHLFTSIVIGKMEVQKLFGPIALKNNVVFKPLKSRNKYFPSFQNVFYTTN